jgi:hypothetical protein
MTSRLLGCPRSVVRDHIDAYFVHIYAAPLFNFLHKVEFLNNYASGTVDTALLLAVCGAASRFLLPTKEDASQAKSWMKRAESMVLQNTSKLKVSNLEALMIVILHYTHHHQFSQAFLHLSLAARMAFTLKINHEDRALSFIEQESRRRLLWCIYSLDRLIAGGVPVSTTFYLLYLQNQHKFATPSVCTT